MKNLTRIDRILINKQIELPYIFQKYLISDLIELGGIKEEEDINLLIEILINLFIELSNGSTCLLLEKDSLFMKKYFNNVYDRIIGDNKPLIIRKEEPFYFLYTYKDYLEELEVENILRQRFQQKILQTFISEDDNINKALSYNTIFITGGAGTGKTTLASQIYLTFYKDFKEKNNKDPVVKITAPTGKAAKVLEKKIRDLTKKEIEGYTIHKLLEYSPTYNTFRYNKDYQLNADLIIVDEASMIDLTLFYNLLNGVSLNTKLVIIGDKEQLPSVDKGNVFADIIENKSLADKVIRLETQYRSNQKITEFSTNIIKEKEPKLNLIKENDLLNILKKEEENVYFIDIREYLEILRIIDIIVEHYKERINESKILSLTNYGVGGVENLNNFIYENYRYKLNKFKNIPIIITENDYENNLFNGDIGIIIEKGKDITEVKFLDDRKIPLHLIKSWKYAFVITVHKSQGSDYNDIFLILPENISNPLLTGELLYTAITRAKKRVFIIGKQEVFFEGINRKFNRYSVLRYINFI